MVVRASGTEAKLKYYFDFREEPADGAAAASAAAGSAATDFAAARYAGVAPIVWADCSAVYAELARRAGYELSARALELPDVMPVQEKAAMR
jgi:hypothetical protein